MQVLEIKLLQNLFQPGLGITPRAIFVARDDEFIFHGMFPAHQLRDRDLIAMRF